MYIFLGYMFPDPNIFCFKGTANVAIGVNEQLAHLTLSDGYTLSMRALVRF